jgi:hypothetical protein
MSEEKSLPFSLEGETVKKVEFNGNTISLTTCRGVKFTFQSFTRIEMIRAKDMPSEESSTTNNAL